jgi:uncharacterized protein YeaO (DUF488 family)
MRPFCAGPEQGGLPFGRRAAQTRLVPRYAIHLRRVYDEPVGELGTRILVDRLWPRGKSRASLHLDAWLPEVAPSPGLRAWYDHVPSRFAEFRARYLNELACPEAAEALASLRRRRRTGALVLLTAVKAVDISHGVVLVQLLRDEDSAES